MSRYILGVSCFYHDSSACILKDGILIAAAEEERFTRKKHDTGFPVNAIKYCLKEAGISISRLDHVGFYEKPLLKFERMLQQHLAKFPSSLKVFCNSLPSWLNEKLRVRRMMRKKLGYKGDIFFVEHHMAHAASSYLVSPFNEAAVYTVDGVGEWTTTAIGKAKGSNIMLEKEINFPHSLGLLYSAITAYLGFSVNNSEYKVMGLSPYGNPDTYYDAMKEMIDIKDDGSYNLDMSYFVFHYKDIMPGAKMCGLLGGPIRKKKDELTQRHKDIAAALQKATEEIIFKALNHLHKETKCDNLVMAGGCALNSVANGKILRNTNFKNIWIQPNASDGGTSIGAAFYVENIILRNKRRYRFTSAYLGPGYSAEGIEKFLDINKIKYSRFKDDDELVKETAKLLVGDNVIGWFQGRMEWGPRALGSRSILSNPANRNMQAILNEKVKHREKFRPFAPVVCEDDALKYFECDSPIPEPADYMLMVYPVKKEFHKIIPAVTHVDGSGRLQTIRRSQNKKYYDLIKEFGRLSGVPILINTSFNIRGEPIVCTPMDAYRCMMGTGIDYLIMDKFLIKRLDNEKHMWDSEKYADD